MTKEKVLEVINLYKKELDDVLSKTASIEEELEHCQTMLPQMEEFIKEDRMDKVFRWLGFIQGVLWCQGVFEIDEMKNHNKP